MQMKRLFLIPFLAALIGGGVVVALVAALGGLGTSDRSVTTIQAAPVTPSNASQTTRALTPAPVGTDAT